MIAIEGQPSQNYPNQMFLQFCPINLRINTQSRIKHGSIQLKLILLSNQIKVDEETRWLQIAKNSKIINCKGARLNMCIKAVCSIFTIKCYFTSTSASPKNYSFKSCCHQQLTHLGDFNLPSEIYISSFHEFGKNIFQQSTQISNNYSLDYEIFVEQSQMQLQKLMLGFKEENRDSNLLTKAFKKTVKNRVKIVEIVSKQVQEIDEPFLPERQVIKSLTKKGMKYFPNKITCQTANQSRIKSETPRKPSYDRSFHLHNSKFQLYQAQTDKNFTQPSLPNSSLSQAQQYNFHNALANRRGLMQKAIDRCLYALFWFVAIVLLYFMMIPSRKLSRP